MSAFLATLANGWAAVSMLATLGGLSGIALVVGALVLGAYLPSTLRHAMVGAGLAILVGAGLFQAGQAHGARQQIALDAKRALDAEKRRVAASVAIAQADAARAARELQAAKSDNAKLRKLNDDLEAQTRAARDGMAAPACLDRDLARRLRDL